MKQNGGANLSFEEKMIQLMRAGYSYFWVWAIEPRRAELVVQRVIDGYTTKKEESFELLVWDITATEWAGALECANKFTKLPRMKAVVARNFNKFITEQEENAPEIMQNLINHAEICQSPEGRKLFIVISGDRDPPADLERDFTSLHFDLPDEEELGKALDLICDSSGIPLLKGEHRRRVVSAAKGLGYDEAKNAFTLSVVANENEKGIKKMVPATISRQRAAIVEKQSSLKVIEYEETLDDLIGLDGVISYVTKTMDSPLAKGVLLLGPTGCGKTHLWKGISNAVNKLMITFSFSQIYQKYYGESEKAIAAVIATVTAIGDCVVLIDEFEKAFAGAGGRGQASGGDVEQRATGEWLKFMQDRPAGIYIAATSNDISKIPPEYLRSERWDTLFYVPMPSDKALEKMMKHYKKVFNVNGTNPDMTGWSGSDVKCCCRTAAMMGVGVKEAAELVTPTSKVKAQEIEDLEREAKEKGYNRADKLPMKVIDKVKPAGEIKRDIDV